MIRILSVLEERFHEIQNHGIVLFCQCANSRFVRMVVIPVVPPSSIQSAKGCAGGGSHYCNKAGRHQEAGEMVHCIQNILQACVAAQIHGYVHVLTTLINVAHPHV